MSLSLACFPAMMDAPKAATHGLVWHEGSVTCEDLPPGRWSVGWLGLICRPTGRWRPRYEKPSNLPDWFGCAMCNALCYASGIGRFYVF